MISSVRFPPFGCVVLLFALWCAAPSDAQAGNEAYCSATAGIVVFAVDVTTPYDQTDRGVIISMTDKILGALRGGDKLIIRTIADSHTRSERLIERCMPYCAADGSFGKFFKCSDGVIRTDTERVRAEIISSLRARLTRFEELKYSDIVRTIHTITAEEVREGRHFYLYVYSDLIENSDYFSPRYLFSYPTVKLISGLHHYKLIASLRGAEVVVSGIGRWDSRDRRPLNVAELNKLTDFWRAYFQESGAQKISISQNPP